MTRTVPSASALDVRDLNRSFIAAVRPKPSGEIISVGCSLTERGALYSSFGGSRKLEQVSTGRLIVPPSVGLALTVSDAHGDCVTLIVLVYSLSDSLLSAMLLNASATRRNVCVPALNLPTEKSSAYA